MRSISYKILIILFLVYSPLFPQGKPTLKQGIIYISRFIASDYFASLKNKGTDIDLIDTLYLRSVKFYNDDYSEALLALTFACLPYREMHLKIPLLPVTLTIPLPVTANPIFEKVFKNLPSRFFYDTPKGEFGDKDKIPHFFGTAFIEYNFSFFNLSKFLGIFVEKFEELFYVQGAMDIRDLYADKLGAKFGKELRNNNHLLPSEILKNYSFGKK